MFGGYLLKIIKKSQLVGFKNIHKNICFSQATYFEVGLGGELNFNFIELPELS